MGAPRSTAEEIYEAWMASYRADGDAPIRDALDLLAQATGENKFRHAAAVIRGSRLGRTAINDSEALRRIDAYPADRRREAVGIVARSMAGASASDAQIEAIAHRLRRKLKRNGRIGSVRPDPSVGTSA